MWEIILQVTVSLLIGSGFFMLNLRALSFHKKGLDPIGALKKTESSVAKALELEKQRQDVINFG